jgi:peptidoglycan/xylan/chitin deacetylase (PgdA/CDA1 family)
MSFRSALSIRTRLRSVVHRIWAPKPKPLVLAYHRVADEPVDFFGLAVSLTRFEQQLQVLRRTRHPLPLERFVCGLIDATLPDNAVALTFDDGYVDNLSAGKPRLAAADIPATVFLTTGYVDHSGTFWWLELARLILVEPGPQHFDVVIRGQCMHFDLGSEPPARDDGTTRPILLKKRQSVLRQLRQSLRLLDDKECKAVMAKIRSIFGRTDYRSTLGRPMTQEEVRTLVKDDLIKLGAHTVTHPVLPALNSTDCKREILESKNTCEAISGQPVVSFAYPYGEFDNNVRERVKAAGFKFACSGRRASAAAGSDVFALPRLHVLNWDGDTFERALNLSVAHTTS